MFNLTSLTRANYRYLNQVQALDILMLARAVHILAFMGAIGIC